MKEHVTLCNGVAHRCVFHKFWMTMELYGTEEYVFLVAVYLLLPG